MFAPARLRFFRLTPALLLCGSLAIPLLADCSGAATCDAVCDNVLDKCTDIETDFARNSCLEQCEQRKQVVPESCAEERDEVLRCLSMAESVDCGDPQQSAACSAENEALADCAADTQGSGGSTGTGNGGAPCETDDECASGLCNWKIEQCSTPGDLGAPCSRDEECAGDLCNWTTDQCSAAGGSGAPCGRDEECVSGQCNETCA